MSDILIDRGEMAANLRTHVEIIFLQNNTCILIEISLKFVSNGITNISKFIIGLDDGLTPNKWQAIIWTNTLGRDQLTAHAVHTWNHDWIPYILKL